MYFRNLKKKKTLLGLSKPFYGYIFYKIQVSLRCRNDVSKKFPVTTTLQHPHFSFHTWFPQHINCKHVYCDIT